jgi:hypothetical protein
MNHMKMKLIIIALGLSFALVLIAQQQRSSPALSPGAVNPDERIISKLSEIVSIRERLAKDYEQGVAAGRAPADGPAEIDLAEARINLARERGQPAAIVAELQGLVAAHERRTKRLRSLASDRVPPGDVERAQAALLETQIRLLRAQK